MNSPRARCTRRRRPFSSRSFDWQTSLSSLIRHKTITPRTGAVSAAGRRSGGDHHAGWIRKFASAVGRLSPPHERGRPPDCDQIEPFCTGHAFDTIRKANGSRGAVRSAIASGGGRPGPRQRGPWPVAGPRRCRGQSGLLPPARHALPSWSILRARRSRRASMSLDQRLPPVSPRVMGQHGVGSVNARPSDAGAQPITCSGR